MKIVLATKNPGKLIEMKELLEGLPLDLVSAQEAGYDVGMVLEDGATFEENALKKARAVSVATGQWALSDDSGLCIDALNGEPGLHTARWAKDNGSDLELAEYALERMKGVPPEKRRANFNGTLALVSPTGEEFVFTADYPLTIAMEKKGVTLPSLPYDAIIIPAGETRTVTEMTPEEKNEKSHRGKAFKKLRIFLEELFATQQ